MSAALYVCYLAADEPLVQTQVLPYLRSLAARGHRMHLLTFETARRSGSELEDLAEGLRLQGVTWHALRYHRWPSLPATLYDIARGAWRAFRIARRHGIRLIHARSHVGAAIALPVSSVTGIPFLFDVRGLLPDEYADAGHWRRGGLKYRLAKAMERVFFRRAQGLVVLTETICTELKHSVPLLGQRDGDMTVIPCCVDLAAYPLSAFKRAAYRAERGWGDRRVIVYVGKLGMWYLDAEMARFFAAARAQDPRLFFEVLTPSPAGTLVDALAAAGVPGAAFAVRRVPPAEVPAVLAAADAGLSFIKPCFSKRSSSPTKVGEYLAAGLPVVSTAGIGDCDRMLADGRGVLLPTLDAAAYERAARELGALIDDAGTAKRCRAFAESELSLERSGAPRYAAIYDRLLGPPGRP